ncbi:MAG: metallophosphoesterase family protein [Chloroflexia bacterium]
MLRIALFSDVHGNLTALNAVLAALAAHHPVQMIVAAGDHTLIGPRPAETWDRLRDAGCICLLGNEDEVLWDRPPYPAEGSPFAPIVHARLVPTAADLGPERLAAMRRMPRSLRLSPALGQELLIVHANLQGLYGWALSPNLTDEDLERLYGGANAAIICCGHYHESSVRAWGETTLVNVASVSLPRDNQPLAAYTILEWDGSWQIAQYRIPYDADAEDAAWATSTIPLTPAAQPRAAV